MYDPYHVLETFSIHISAYDPCVPPCMTPNVNVDESICAPSTSSRPYGAAIPTELILQILESLDIVSLLTSRASSRRFRDIIDANKIPLAKNIMARERSRLQSQLNQLNPSGLAPDVALRRQIACYGLPLVGVGDRRRHDHIFGNRVACDYRLCNPTKITFWEADVLFYIMLVLNDWVQDRHGRTPCHTLFGTPYITPNLDMALWRLAEGGSRLADDDNFWKQFPCQYFPSLSSAELRRILKGICAAPLDPTPYRPYTDPSGPAYDGAEAFTRALQLPRIELVASTAHPRYGLHGRLSWDIIRRLLPKWFVRPWAVPESFWAIEDVPAFCRQRSAWRAIGMMLNKGALDVRQMAALMEGIRLY